jgi:DNA-binding response OmpR family regulator
VIGQLVLVTDGLERCSGSVLRALRGAGLEVQPVSAAELADVEPVDAVLVKIERHDPAEACVRLRDMGHRTIVALTNRASSDECIRLLNAGADYYLDATAPSAELVARVGVAVRFSSWMRTGVYPADLPTPGFEATRVLG